MGFIETISALLPEVKGPERKQVSFNEKAKWTLIILISFFILGIIPLFGLGNNALQQFEYLSIIMGAKFGSLISLGIGPIVTASIVLQLLQGSGILKFNLHSEKGKKKFQGLQKILGVFFILFEAGIYVFMGGLAPANTVVGISYFILQLLLIVQLTVGGLMIMLMDDVINKWGFGSGISLFIAAGVSQSIFIRLLNPFTQAGLLGYPFGSGAPVGQFFSLFYSLSIGNPTDAGLAITAIVATIVVFMMAVYAQAMKIEIPLSFGRVRGHGIRWPLNFIYASNIPVILVAALMANIQLIARLLEKWGHPLLGTFQGNTPVSGLIVWLHAPSRGMGGLVGMILKNGSFAIGSQPYLQALTYICFMAVGSIIFGIFWVQTAGMDASSQAENILSSGLQMPGFRKDKRVLEKILNRYIWPLTIMGSISVGFLAASADLLGALSNGTGILLTVMIIYKLYEEIAKQHMMDMHPLMKKFM